MSKEILFRASGSGDLTVKKKGAGITENQLKELEKLNTKVREGGNLTENQKKKHKELTDKKNAPFQLSETAKRFIEEMWLFNEKGYYKDINSKYLDKGLFGEEDGITLVSEIDGNFYKKNTERITKGHLTGECDIVCTINGKKVIQDIKCSWDPSTLIKADLTNLYKWQGMIYMYLYDAEEFWLRYCLVDCPAHIYESERWKLKNKFDIIDEDQEEVRPLFEQLKTNLIYSDNPNYTKEERVKTFKITRDDEAFKELLDVIPHAVKYYNSLKLNNVNV